MQRFGTLMLFKRFDIYISIVAPRILKSVLKKRATLCNISVFVSVLIHSLILAIECCLSLILLLYTYQLGVVQIHNVKFHWQLFVMKLCMFSERRLGATSFYALQGDNSFWLVYVFFPRLNIFTVWNIANFSKLTIRYCQNPLLCNERSVL